MTDPKNKTSEAQSQGRNASSVDPQVQAHQQAEKDIAGDLETSAHSPHDDLDEGELARLGEKGNPIE